MAHKIINLFLSMVAMTSCICAGPFGSINKKKQSFFKNETYTTKSAKAKGNRIEVHQLYKDLKNL